MTIKKKYILLIVLFLVFPLLQELSGDQGLHERIMQLKYLKRDKDICRQHELNKELKNLGERIEWLQFSGYYKSPQKAPSSFPVPKDTYFIEIAGPAGNISNNLARYIRIGVESNNFHPLYYDFIKNIRIVKPGEWVVGPINVDEPLSSIQEENTKRTQEAKRFCVRQNLPVRYSLVNDAEFYPKIYGPGDTVTNYQLVKRCILKGDENSGYTNAHYLGNGLWYRDLWSCDLHDLLTKRYPGKVCVWLNCGNNSTGEFRGVTWKAGNDDSIFQGFEYSKDEAAEERLVMDLIHYKELNGELKELGGRIDWVAFGGHGRIHNEAPVEYEIPENTYFIQLVPPGCAISDKVSGEIENYIERDMLASIDYDLRKMIFHGIVKETTLPQYRAPVEGKSLSEEERKEFNKILLEKSPAEYEKLVRRGEYPKIFGPGETVLNLRLYRAGRDLPGLRHNSPRFVRTYSMEFRERTMGKPICNEEYCLLSDLLERHKGKVCVWTSCASGYLPD
ncbi:MAG: hypothetical protein GY754_22115 [bacterium]|nr:hypothetical protein [bacterium]